MPLNPNILIQSELFAIKYKVSNKVKWLTIRPDTAFGMVVGSERTLGSVRHS
jgi:hypothetical protein